jgi:hypothetical protein
MACALAFLGTETAMADHKQDVEEQRAQIQERLSDPPEAEEDERRDEASLAPPGHLGERMNENERRD